MVPGRGNSGHGTAGRWRMTKHVLSRQIIDVPFTLEDRDRLMRQDVPASTRAMRKAAQGNREEYRLMKEVECGYRYKAIIKVQESVCFVEFIPPASTPPTTTAAEHSPISLWDISSSDSRKHYQVETVGQWAKMGDFVPTYLVPSYAIQDNRSRCFIKRFSFRLELDVA
ncbi:hypothetical protein K439DRAFT_1615209 [Ramaria rubella]|nr:hypothetical protein K439DRAFT_1615209 [Ramaria rubella]